MERVTVGRIKRSKDNLTSSLFDEASDQTPSRASRGRETSLPRGLKAEDYEVDPDDGYVREITGPWVRDKHARLAKYVDISSAVRRNWVRKGPAGATYIDLFSGPGRCRIKDTAVVLPGSALVAWTASLSNNATFTDVVVGDAHPAICDAVEYRLSRLRAPIHRFHGPATDTVDHAISRINHYSLHLAFLDPYDLKALPFEIIKKLAMLEHMDILIHFSLQDLTRNLRKYIAMPTSPLDTFVPDWRPNIDVNRPDDYVRARVFEYWRALLGTIDMKTTEAAELVSGPQRQPLYWLAFAARHSRALEFWEKIRRLQPDPQLGILA